MTIDFADLTLETLINFMAAVQKYKERKPLQSVAQSCLLSFKSLMADRKLNTNQKKNDYALNSMALALALMIIYLVSISMSNEKQNAASLQRHGNSLGAAINHAAKSAPGLSRGSLKQAAKGSPAS